MSSLSKPYLTPEQYLELERKADFKSEYYQGEMFPMAGPRTEAMAGARRNHNRAVVNAAASLHAQLRGTPCEVFSNDMRVGVGEPQFYTYPDIVIACEPRFLDEQGDTLINPVAIIEVLSPSTEAYDRGNKFALYRTLGSLREYVLVSSDRMQVERYSRRDGGQWLLTAVTGVEQSIDLESAGCSLRLADVYERVEFQ